MPKKTAIARFTGNHQVSIPKPVREAVGLTLGDFVELTAERGTIVMRPKQLTNKPVPKGKATAAERRAIKRGRAEVTAGETIAYERYQADRKARLERQRRQKRTKAAR
jgi:AbrB family looped-hinge helix DNA binding protein